MVSKLMIHDFFYEEKKVNVKNVGEKKGQLASERIRLGNGLRANKGR